MKKFSYKVSISYKGRHYYGWQKQVDQKTIQGELERSLKKISKSDEVYSIGSGRTDAGVHALAQVARIDLPLELPAESLKKALNSFLPEDIRVIETEECDQHFHPTRDALDKEYYYLIAAQKPSVFDYPYMSYFKGPIDFELLSQMVCVFQGEHDFCHYMCHGTPVNTTVRTIYEIELLPPGNFDRLSFSTPFYTLKVRGSGFLKQMVRLMVGALIKSSQSKLTREQLEASLTSSESPRHIAPVAPAQGLYLGVVNYPNN